VKMELHFHTQERQENISADALADGLTEGSTVKHSILPDSVIQRSRFDKAATSYFLIYYTKKPGNYPNRRSK